LNYKNTRTHVMVVLYIEHEYLAVMKYYLIALGGTCAFTEMPTALLCPGQCADSWRHTVRGNARCQHFSLAIISV